MRLKRVSQRFVKSLSAILISSAVILSPFSQARGSPNKLKPKYSCMLEGIYISCKADGKKPVYVDYGSYNDGKVFDKHFDADGSRLIVLTNHHLHISLGPKYFKNGIPDERHITFGMNCDEGYISKDGSLFLVRVGQKVILYKLSTNRLKELIRYDSKPKIRYVKFIDDDQHILISTYDPYPKIFDLFGIEVKRKIHQMQGIPDRYKIKQFKPKRPGGRQHPNSKFDIQHRKYFFRRAHG